MESFKGKTYGINPAFSKAEDDPQGGRHSIGANSLDHYGIIQSEMRARIASFDLLSCQERTLFSAHEAQGEDEDTREGQRMNVKKPIRGPALVGRKCLPARDTGECIHFERYVQGAKTLVRAHFEPHPDPVFTHLIYPACKPRIPAEKMPLLMAKYPGGYFEPGTEKGLDEFLEYEDKCMEGALEDLKKWKEEIDAK